MVYVSLFWRRSHTFQAQTQDCGLERAEKTLSNALSKPFHAVTDQPSDEISFQFQLGEV